MVSTTYENLFNFLDIASKRSPFKSWNCVYLSSHKGPSKGDSGASECLEQCRFFMLMQRVDRCSPLTSPSLGGVGIRGTHPMESPIRARWEGDHCNFRLSPERRGRPGRRRAPVSPLGVL